MRVRTVFVQSLLILSLISGVLAVYFWYISDRTMVWAERPVSVRVMRIAANDHESVIVPQESVRFINDQPYVLLVDEHNLTHLQMVTATAWRGDYYRVQGLHYDDLLVLSSAVEASQAVSYDLINPL